MTDVLTIYDLIADKKHSTFFAEVVTGKNGGVAGGASIDYATNQVTGQSQKTLPAVLRDAGFRPAPFTFVTGGVLAIGDSDRAVLWPISAGGDGQYYIWKGAYPKTVPANSTPAASGGVSDSGWLPMGDITLRSDLAAIGGGELVGFGSRTVATRLKATPYVKDYLSLSDALAAGTNMLVFEAGTYPISSDTVISCHCVINKGASLVISSGAKLTFTGHIEAGHYKIFSHSVDMTANYTASAPVVIAGCAVKAAWFADKVDALDSIKTIADQTNNLIVAARAAFGDFIADGSDFISTHHDGVLDFCQGYWRVDKEFAPSKQHTDGKFYKLAGGTIRGVGAGSSYLVRTLMTSTDIIFKVGRYTGELTNIHGLTVTAYNPNGVTPAEKFDSSAKAVAFLQGDSLLLRDFWASGAKVASRFDVKLCYRDGVGIQFSSCIDTHLEGVFVEYCVTGMAFASSEVTGSGITLFNTLRTSIGLGNFLSEGPDQQGTSSTVQLSKVLGANLVNNAITSLEIGTSSHIDISGAFNGYNTSTLTQTGTVPIRVAPGTWLRGIVRGVFRNWVGSIVAVESQSRLGDEANQFIMNEFSVSGLTGVGAVIKLAPDAFAFATIANGSISKCQGGLVSEMVTNSNITLRDLSLSEYTGQIDGSVNRSLFAVVGGKLNIINVIRNLSDATLLNQYGWCASPGAAYIDATIANATRSVPGGGSVTMPQKVAFA